MSTPTVERTGDWDSLPFAGGYAGLHDLAADEFSGTITAGPARLFMLRGSVIGVLDGEIEDFEDAAGTAREAPHPALPLLAVMQEHSEEVRAQYYTEETPISDVDRTLSDGNFTGYVELSENVLSGDYYQVYHQGHSMSVAYVGAAERLITDDEAFEQADDEVGIYEVRPVDIDVVEIPEAADDAGPSGSAVDGASGTAASDTDSTPAGDLSVDEDSPGAETTTPPDDGQPVDESSPSADGPIAEGPAAESETDPVDDTDAGAGTQPTAPSTEPEPATGDDGGADGNELADTSRPSSGSAADAGGDRGSRAGGPREAGPSRDPSGEPSGDPSGGRQAETGASPEQSTGVTSTESTPEGTGREAASSTSPDSTGPPDTSGGVEGHQGRPAPDHPAAGSGGQSGDGTSAGADLGASDLEVRSLPSLDPSKTASASRQERERRAASSSASPPTDGDRTPSSGGQSQEPATPRNGPSNAPTGAADPAPGENGPATSEGTPATAGADTETPEEPAATSGGGSPGSEAGAATNGDGAAESGAPERGEDTAVDTESDASASQPESSADGTALEDAREEVERLEADLADLRGDHEAVVEERDRLEEELADAREEIERLRERLEEATGGAGEASRTLSPRQAIDETNLFIRYDSKGEATLEKAHAGDVDKAAVDENMRLEYHTSFDAADAAVDGVGFDQFLTDTVQYRFVDWLVRQLLYEIRDTGNTGTMGDLYDAIPRVDRAELNGQVGVQYTEDGQEHRAQIGFDVIVRDRMGNPLIVANLNDSRDPATEDMMTDLVRAAERVGESSDSLAGAFLVTRSFFEPGALETAEEATAGGLLNRGKQKSFVNLSRKGGYHLCLVEARNQEFHLAVPEL